MRFMCVNGQWRDYNKKCQTFPLQPTKDLPRVVAEEAYKEYSTCFGTQQSLDRIGERSGFGAAEIAILLFHRIERLQQELHTTKLFPGDG